MLYFIAFAVSLISTVLVLACLRTSQQVQNTQDITFSTREMIEAIEKDLADANR